MIYIDIYVIINVLMNIWLLFLCHKLFDYTTSWWRLLLGGIVGSIWAVISLVTKGLFQDISFFITLLIGFLMCCIAYPVTAMKYRVVAWIRFMVIAFIMGGMLNAFYFHLNLRGGIRQFLYGEKGIIGNYLFVVIGIIGICMVGVYGGYKRKKQEQKPLIEVTMKFQNRKVEVVALIDSGNRLYLPQVEETKKNAVSLIDDEIANQLFGTEIGNYLKNPMMHLEDFLSKGVFVHMVPFQSVGEERGLLPAIRITSMTIKQDTGEKTMIEPLIGISPTKFSKDKEYKMILHPNV